MKMGAFKESFVIATAKKPEELEDAYQTVKGHAKDYGFASVSALKAEVVKKAMTEAKKPAEFIVQAQSPGAHKGLFLDLVCDVNKKMSTVLARKELKTIKEYDSAKALAKLKNLEKNKAEMFGV
jgi:hypothetical protein